jgi:hypothetical protein
MPRCLRALARERMRREPCAEGQGAFLEKIREPECVRRRVLGTSVIREDASSSLSWSVRALSPDGWGCPADEVP